MAAFRRVEADQAGPAALGILIPPSRRTFVILRPRSMAYDLLLCRSELDFSFLALSHDEASATAQAVFRGLREGLARTAGRSDAMSILRLLAFVGPYAFVACPRLADQPYVPLASTPEEVEALAAILCPCDEQEVYFNTRFFERSS